MSSIQFSILISTKNRCEDLLFTLHKIKPLLTEQVTCVVYDDGSSDATAEKVKALFPEVQLQRNSKSKGYMYCRNKMLNETKAHFAISLDDDAHFLLDHQLDLISSYFLENPSCGVIAARILWTKEEPLFVKSDHVAQRVKGFVGCGHVWRMEAWRAIPNYPEWFEFYGEESYASLQLIKKKWEVHYVPSILVQHRVNLKERAQNKSQFAFRHRRSLRADWFNYVMFLPFYAAFKNMGYSIVMQWKSKIFKGNFEVMLPLFLAFFDLVIYFPKLIKQRNAFTKEEYGNYLKLNEAKIYWEPEK